MKRHECGRELKSTNVNDDGRKHSRRRDKK